MEYRPKPLTPPMAGGCPICGAKKDAVRVVCWGCFNRLPAGIQFDLIQGEAGAIEHARRVLAQ